MSTYQYHNEKGQVLILLAVGLVALLGFTALAIDGGAVFFDRRSAQNAADAAALAGVHALAKDPWPVTSNLATSDARYMALDAAIHTAAQNRAHDNQYGTADGKVVTVTWPLSNLTGIHQIGSDTNLKHYVKVTITSTVNTSFVHLIGFGTIKNTVEAVAHIIPPIPGPAFSGAGMVALAPHMDGAVTAQGSAVVTVAGGGLFVNSNSAASIKAGGALTFYTPTSRSVGGYDDTKVLIDVVPGPELKNYTPQIPYPPDLPFPDPLNPANGFCLTNSVKTTEVIGGNTYAVYGPGKMLNGIPQDQFVKLKSGVFCISLDKNPERNINNSQTFIDDGGGVLLVLTGIDPCNATINAQAHVHLSSQGSGAYKGLIMYVDPKGYALQYNLPSTSGDKWPLKLNGGENILMKGTIYAPTCQIQLNGNGGNSYRGQVVGFSFDIVGGAIVKLIYIDSENIDAKPKSGVDLNQ